MIIGGHMRAGEIWKKRFLEPDNNHEYISQRYMKLLKNLGKNFEEDTEWECEEWWENGKHLEEVQHRIAEYSAKTIYKYFEKVRE
jgi:hypothetical protein